MDSPKHMISVCEVRLPPSSAAGSVIVTGKSNVHIFASLAVMVYAPAGREPNNPEDWNDPAFSRYSYGPVPPVPLTVMLPLLSPLHKTLLCELTVTPNAAAGPAMVPKPMQCNHCRQ